MEEKKRKIKSLLRSVLISSKEGIPRESFNKEYRILTNEKIPFRELGFQTLDDFIASIPDVVRIERRGPETIYVAVADASTAKLKELVDRQKTSKRASIVRKPLSRQRQPYNSFDYYSSRIVRPREPYHNTRPPLSLLGRPPLIAGPPCAVQTNIRAKQSQYKKPPHAQNERTPDFTEDIKFRINFPESYEVPPRFKKAYFNENSVTKADLPPPNIASFTEGPDANSKNQNNTNIDSTKNHYIQILNDYIQREKKEPIFFKNFQIGRKLSDRSKQEWVSLVTVDNRPFGSVQSFPTKNEAENEAAKNAVEHFKLNSDSKNNVPVDVHVILERVWQIVDGHKNGVWNTKVAVVYKDKYGENLPDNCITNLQLHPKCLKLESIGGRFIIYPGDMSFPDYMQYIKNNNVEELLDSESDENSMFGDSLSEPDPISVPQGHLWDVYVTFVNSSVDVSVRIIGEEYSEKYEALLAEMETFYKEGKGTRATKIDIGQIYVAAYNNEWCRVRVIDKKYKIKIFFVDEGDRDEIDRMTLYYIEPQFNKLPYQALKCELHKLQTYSDSLEVLDHLVENVQGKSFVAEVIKNDEVLELNLFDTSTNDLDILVNDVILEKVGGLAFYPPELPQPGELCKVIVSYVDPSGLLYVQVSGPGFKAFEEMLIEINQKFKENPDIEPADVHDGKLCFAKFPLDDLWYRAHITKILESDGKAEVHFVDYGNKDVICVNDIWRPDNDLLHRLPLQAIPVTLFGYPVMDPFWTEENFKYVVNETMDYNGDMVLQVIEPPRKSGMPASVELFQRGIDGQITHVTHKLTNIEQERFLRSVEVDSSLPQSPSSSEHSSIPQSPQFLKTDSEDDALNYELLNGKLDSDEQQAILEKFPNINSDRCISRDSKGKVSPDIPVSEDTTVTQQLTSKSPSLNAGLSNPPALDIPNVGEYFDVFVSLAMDPGNFTCQPWKMGGYLELLMFNLQEFYSKKENLVQMENVIPDQLYAAKHPEDEQWYRVLAKELLKVAQEEAVSVYFVDYGDFGLCNVSNLQPLREQFRTLPCQAIRAQLSGVLPTGSHWSPTEREAFSSLVLDKPLVAFIINHLVLPTSQHMIIITIKLIDTSSEGKDLYIDEEMISRGLARAT